MILALSQRAVKADHAKRLNYVEEEAQICGSAYKGPRHGLNQSHMVGTPYTESDPQAIAGSRVAPL